jgi:hypothetical protein
VPRLRAKGARSDRQGPGDVFLGRHSAVHENGCPKEWLTCLEMERDVRGMGQPVGQFGAGPWTLPKVNRPSMRAEQCRRLAQQCWRLAQMIPPHARASLREMAHVWQRLADEQGRATNVQ